MGRALSLDDRSAVGNFPDSRHSVAGEKVEFCWYWIDLFLGHIRTPDIGNNDPATLDQFVDVSS